jgi:hypothetical protein
MITLIAVISMIFFLPTSAGGLQASSYKLFRINLKLAACSLWRNSSNQRNQIICVITVQDNFLWNLQGICISTQNFKKYEKDSALVVSDRNIIDILFSNRQTGRL